MRRMIANSTKLKLFFLAVTLIVTLFFGLHPKDFGPEHKPFINIAEDLEFTRYSLATAEANFTALPDSNDIRIQKQAQKRDDFTLDISLVVPQMPEANTRFSTIFSVNDANNDSVILLGQWTNYLIIMSGDDYPNKSAQPRITVSLDSVVDYVYPQELRIQIQATQAATSLTINEQQMAVSSGIMAPLGPPMHRVSLGNTLDRKQGWEGTLREFSLKASNGAPQTQRIELNLKPLSAWTLHSAFRVFGKQWLSLGSLEQGFTDSFNRDVVINLLGFVPLSLALYIIFSIQSQPVVAVLQTIGASAFVSFVIESAQVLLPSRTSSLIDLAVNTLAGVLTALACYLALQWLNRRKLHATKPPAH